MALSASADRLEKKVLTEVSELGMCITFIIDQANTLDAVDDGISNKKRQVRRFLDILPAYKDLFFE